jgi:hypothetical protein
MRNAILDPTGRADAKADAASALALAPRRAGLAGLRVGLLENSKHNAALLLAEIGKLLISEHGAAGTVMTTKSNFAAPVSSDVVGSYRDDCDVVITGVGDCGSCSASAVADGIAFEQAGLPAVVICSDAFTVTADAMAGLRGAPGYRYVVTEHPVAVLTAGQVTERAKQLLPDVVSMLTRQPAGGTGGRPPGQQPAGGTGGRPPGQQQ